MFIGTVAFGWQLPLWFWDIFMVGNTIIPVGAPTRHPIVMGMSLTNAIIKYAFP